MDVKERLSLDDIRTETLLTSEHLHRYHFVARLLANMRVLDLCCGTGYGTKILAEHSSAVVGIDNSRAAIEEAIAGASASNVRYEVADALDFLRGDRDGEFDAIVCFEGIEHLPDAESALEELERLHVRGTRLALSVPNSKLFEEENPFHLTDFGYDEARVTFSRFPGVTIACQFLAEGSLLDIDDGSRVEAELVAPERLEAEAANHFIALVGFDTARLGEVSGRFKLAAAPNYNSYMRGLEAAYTDLYRANLELARKHLGKTDSAAAASAARLSDTRRAHENALLEIERVSQRVRELEEEVRATHARYEAPRYWIMDALRDALGRIPALGLLLSAAGAALHKRRTER